MSTRNTLNDIRFAEDYLKFVGNRGRSREGRARARVLLATIAMLDAKHPTWREELLVEFDRQDISREIDQLFSLPEIDIDSLFADFIDLTTGRQKRNE